MAKNAPQPPSRNYMILRIGAAALGISAGVMVGICFFRWWNIHVIFWGFFSAIWALFALKLHIFYKLGRLPIYVKQLRGVIYAGIIGQIIGSVAMTVYLILGGVYHDDLKDLTNTYFVAAVWGFMTWKWAFVLFWYGRQYRQIILGDALIPVDQPNDKQLSEDGYSTASTLETRDIE